MEFSGERGEKPPNSIPPEHQETFDEHRETMLLPQPKKTNLEEAVLEEADIDPRHLVCLAERMHGWPFSTRIWRKCFTKLGRQPLLEGVLKLLPNPLQRPATLAKRLDEEEELVEMTADGSLVALVFKVQMWEGRRHVFVRIYRGSLAPGDKIAISGKDKVERIARVFDIDASSKKRLETATAGQIALLAGLRDATTGDTLCPVEDQVLLERIDTKEPVLGLAVEADSTKDEEKLLDVLGKICEEDPTLRFEEDAETGQRILKGMGELHLQIIFEQFREFNLKSESWKPRVVSRETGPGQAQTVLDRVENGRLRSSLEGQGDRKCPSTG